MVTRPVDLHNLTMLRMLAPVVLDADIVVMAGGSEWLQLRFRWWNWLLLGAPGRAARSRIARALAPVQVRA
jgi:hypothetical protein